MKTTTSLMAGASRFAHFAGLTRASRRAADDDDKKGRRADEDDDGKDADDDDGDDEEPKGKRSRRASDDDDDKQGRASDDDDDDDGKDASDGDDDDDDQPKGKRSRRASEDDDKDAEDDDEDEMKGKGAVASARRREQARIAHILGHKAAGDNPALAASLACETRLTRHEAVRVLKSTPASSQASEAAGGRRPNRHARTERNVQLGSDGSAPTGKTAVAASWDAAFAKVGVKRQA